MGTAHRLAARFVEKHGCVEGTVIEAAALADACDVTLTRHDGMAFSVICIVDAEDRESKRFEVKREVAKEILSVCCHRHSGTLQGAKQPATLVIVEVRRSVREEDIDRLRGYSNRFFDKNVIHAFAVDMTMNKVVTATRYSWLSGLGWRRFLQAELSSITCS